MEVFFFCLNYEVELALHLHMQINGFHPRCQNSLTSISDFLLGGNSTLRQREVIFGLLRYEQCSFLKQNVFHNFSSQVDMYVHNFRC
jgi:hypothetical protein